MFGFDDKELNCYTKLVLFVNEIIRGHICNFN